MSSRFVPASDFVGLDTLEPRLLMAADPTVAFKNGAVTVNGTAAADTIRVNKLGGSLRVQVPDAVDPTQLRTIFGTALKKVKKIVVNGHDGDDLITVSPAIRINAFLNGGNGDDNIIGGNGHDTLRGGAGDDGLFGGAGNDRIFGDAGIDALGGQKGNDHLVGGADPDSIFGHEGNDTLDARDGSSHDTVIGGTGKDTLLADLDLFKVPEGIPAVFHQCEIVVTKGKTSFGRSRGVSAIAVNVIDRTRLDATLTDLLPAVQNLIESLQQSQLPAVQRIVVRLQDFHRSLVELADTGGARIKLQDFHRLVGTMQDFHRAAETLQDFHFVVARMQDFHFILARLQDFHRQA